jgi:geranylgeranyl reductase
MADQNHAAASETIWDAVVIGGGPAGATAAHDLTRRGRRVLLLDRAGRIKPCGGAIPPQLMRDFDIPESLLVARARTARMISPSDERVDIPIENGYVGLVDRDVFDEWLRERARSAGAERRTGIFERVERDADGTAVVVYRARRGRAADSSVAANGKPTTLSVEDDALGDELRVRARYVIGADGAKSEVARQCVEGAEKTKYVFAYHEILKSPEPGTPGWDGSRCDVIYRGTISPDFYGWVFPHGDTLSVGTGSADRGFSLRNATQRLREVSGLGHCEILRREGAPIPLKPLPRWDNGRDVVLAGDAAGVVAPASGEGIFYAMTGGRQAAQSVEEALSTGQAKALAGARKRFMKEHGRVFWVLGIMQHFWYSSDKRRERFVSICRDKDVQTLTFDAYMNKRLVRAKPMAHVRIFFKDVAHLLGLARV